MSVPLAIAEIVRAATRPAVSGEAAVTAGVEAALAADRRYWSRQLLARLGDVPVTASGHRELIATWPKSSSQPPTKSTTDVGGHWQALLDLRQSLQPGAAPAAVGPPGKTRPATSAAGVATAPSMRNLRSAW
jgi:hypothetical protein